MSEFVLEAGDLAGLNSHLSQLGWPAVQRAVRIGDGNMNMTVRAWAENASLILKQSRPWVVKYPQIPAPVERAEVEAKFYRLVSGLAGVASRMPKLLGFDAGSHLLWLEDLDEVPSGGLSEGVILELTAFLTALHQVPVPSLPNRAMRALNHEHQYDLPLRPDNGLGYQALAAPLLEDSAYCERVSALGRRYLADGKTLLHGDFFPGSWLRTARGIAVIDPEFCYLGDAEYDLGVFLAHLELMGDGALWGTVMSHYTLPVDWNLAKAYAGVEIMRRLIGVAQLPLQADFEQKKLWLQLSRELVCQ
jgi:5-methylthioribose kinase